MIDNTALFWFNAFVSMCLVAFALYRAWFLHKETRKRTMAVLLNKDRTPPQYVRVESGKETFSHKKCRYVVDKPQFKHNNTGYIFYLEGQSEPINLYDPKESRISADVLHVVMENAHVKALNDASTGLFSNLSTQQMVMIGVVALVGLWALFGR